MIFSYDAIVSVALRFIYVFLFCRTLANDARENGNDSDTSIDRKQSSNKKPTSMASEKIVEKNKVSSEEDMKKEVKSSLERPGVARVFYLSFRVDRVQIKRWIVQCSI